jgi:hypothetical protein
MSKIFLPKTSKEEKMPPKVKPDLIDANFPQFRSSQRCQTFEDLEVGANLVFARF